MRCVPGGPVIAEDHENIFPFLGPAEKPIIGLLLISASSFCMRFELAAMGIDGGFTPPS